MAKVFAYCFVAMCLLLFASPQPAAGQTDPELDALHRRLSTSKVCAQRTNDAANELSFDLATATIYCRKIPLVVGNDENLENKFVCKPRSPRDETRLRLDFPYLVAIVENGCVKRSILY